MIFISKFKISNSSVDLTDKLENLKIKCPTCGSYNTDLEIDYGLYPEGGWFEINISCNEWECEEVIKIYSADEGKIKE